MNIILLLKTDNSIKNCFSYRFREVIGSQFSGKRNYQQVTNRTLFILETIEKGGWKVGCNDVTHPL